jgi:long-chain acyl-CoA synthetase
MEEKFWHNQYDFNIPTSIRYPHIPAHELMNIAASTFPNKPALDLYGSQMTFWQVRDELTRMANALAALDI